MVVVVRELVAMDSSLVLPMCCGRTCPCCPNGHIPGNAHQTIGCATRVPIAVVPGVHRAGACGVAATGAVVVGSSSAVGHRVVVMEVVPAW